MPAPTADDVTWCSPLGMHPIYESFSLAEGETRRHLCPDCGASVEAHSALDFSYVPAHPVRIAPDPRMQALFARPRRIAFVGAIDARWWLDAAGKVLPDDHPLMQPVDVPEYHTIDWWAEDEALDFLDTYRTGGHIIADEHPKFGLF